MTEIDVTLTDYILCIESFIFAIIVSKYSAPIKYKFSYLVLFFGFSASSFLGGTYHGFIKNPILWQATIISIGISAYGFALSGISLILKSTTLKTYRNILLALLGIYILTTFIYQSFLIAIIIYLPATILTLIGFTKFNKERKNKNISFGIFGLYLSLFAPLIQQLKISIHPVFFTHNAVYHVIVMIALFLFFKGVTRVLNILNNSSGD